MSSASSGILEEDLARTYLRMDTTYIKELTMWVMDASGSVMARVDAVVRKDTLIWRVLICVWSSCCFDS